MLKPLGRQFGAGIHLQAYVLVKHRQHKAVAHIQIEGLFADAPNL